MKRPRAKERRKAREFKHRQPQDANERYALDQCLTHHTEQQEARYAKR